MPITKSAKKALRQAEKRRKQNKEWAVNLKKNLKLPKNFSSEEEKSQWLSRAYKAVDKSAKRGAIQKNKAARMKSRLARLIKT